MKALSIWPEYATEIAKGEKTEEYRVWQTDYRGDLLICSSAKKQKGFLSGHALCIVTLVDIDELIDDTYAWILENPRMIKPIPLKGQLHLWDYDGPIELIPKKEWCPKKGASYKTICDRWDSFVEKYWKPLM